MSIVPPTQNSFTEFYKPRVNIDMVTGGEPPVFPTLPGQGEQLGVLGRTIDILSRPLRLVSNPIMKILELPIKLDEIKARENAGEVVPFSEKLGTVANATWPVAAAKGFFSDNPENKPYWSDIIEQTSDTVNRYNPNYEDVENNVNPVVKGIAGFVGDVALDPLTWVPGAAIAKGIQIAGRGAKAVKGATQGLTGASSKVAAEGAETFVKAADNIPVAQGAQKATSVIADALKAGDVPESAFVSGLRQAINEPKFGAAKNAPFLTTKVSETLAKLQKSLDVDVPTGAPVPGKAVSRDEWDQSFTEALVTSPEFAQEITFAPVTYYGKTYDNAYDVLVDLSDKRFDGFIKKFGDEIREQLDPRFTQFVEEVAKDKRVDILGRLPERRVVSGATAAVMRLANLAQKELDNAEAVLGKPLLSSLRNMDEARFAEFLDNIQPVLERTGVVESMGVIKAGSAENKLLNRFNISKPQYDAAVRDMEHRIGMLATGALPKAIDDAIDELSDDASFQEYVGAVLAQISSPNKPFAYNTDAVEEDFVKGIVQALTKSLSKFDKKALAKEYPWLQWRSGVLVAKDMEQLGAGTAIITDKYETFAQANAWRSLSEHWNKLITGVPKLDYSTTPPTWMKGERGEYLFEELPAVYAQRKRRGEIEGSFGFERADIIEDLLLNSSRIGDDVLSSKGLAITMDLPTAAGRVTKVIRYSDVYQVLRNTMVNKQYRWLQLTHVNANSGAANDAFQDAFMTMMVGGSREEMLEAIRRGTTRWGNKSNNNSLAPDSKGNFKEFQFGFEPRTGFTASDIKSKTPPLIDKGMRWEPRWNKKTGEFSGYAGMWDMGVAAERLVDNMLANRQVFDEIIDIRESLYKARSVLDFEAVSSSAARSLLNMFTNPKRQGEGILATNNVGKMINDYVKGIDATELGAAYSDLAIQTAIPSAVRRAAQAAEDIAEAMRTGNPEDVYKARQKAAKGDQEEAAKIRKDAEDAAQAIDDTPDAFTYVDKDAADEVIPSRNIAESLAGLPGGEAVGVGVMRILNALNGKYKMDTRNHITAYNEMISMSIRSRRFAAAIASKMENLKQYGLSPDGQTGYLEVAMKSIQAGTRLEDITDPVLRAAQADVEDLLAGVVNIQVGAASINKHLEKTIFSTAFGRAGATIPKLNNLLRRHAVLGLGKSEDLIDLGRVAADAERLGVDEMTAALEQWRTWEITDTRRFLAGMNAAMFDLANEASFIDNFFTYFARPDVGFATTKASVAAEKGFVKITSDGYSHFGDMIPNNFYLAPEAAEILQAMDQSLRTTKSLTSPLGEFVMNTLDPLTQTWKYVVTVIRPGHHFRNEIGSQSMRFFHLGATNFAKAERLAYRVMGMRKNYTDVDILKGIQANGDTAMMGGETVVSFKFGNKREKLTADQVHLLLERYLFDTGATVEDLFENLGKEKFGKIVETAGAVGTFGLGVRGGRIERLAFGVSEFVEHKARASHFIQALLQMSDGKAITRGIGQVAKPKNLDEAIQFAVEAATKYHPNASTLSPYEMRYGRRTFPFYSWVKQAAMALVEASIMHPARTWLTLPKASFNMAVAAGVDPNSLGDPFPQDQLFPSYLRDDMMGPQLQLGGRYVSINPGFASADVFNDLLANPIEGVVGMVNPAIKIPLELLAGSRLGSQAPIRDLSDYIDSSIPGVNYASNITGRSISTLGIQEQAKIASGAKTSFDQYLSAFNWFTGLGVRNLSRPDFINYAEIEARNRANMQR
jgi:hypothetical protein